MRKTKLNINQNQLKRILEKSKSKVYEDQEKRIKQDKEANNDKDKVCQKRVQNTVLNKNRAVFLKVNTKFPP